MSVYMNIEGISGNSTAKGLEGWIELSSFNFGVSRSINTRSGLTGNRQPTMPALSDVELHKYVDKSSNKLLQKAFTGDSIPLVTIVCTNTGASLQKYFQHKLYDVIITRRQVYANGVDHPTESLTLNFAKVEERYTPRTSSNALGTPASTGYDLTTATVE